LLSFSSFLLLSPIIPGDSLDLRKTKISAIAILAPTLAVKTSWIEYSRQPTRFDAATIIKVRAVDVKPECQLRSLAASKLLPIRVGVLVSGPSNFDLESFQGLFDRHYVPSAGVDVLRG
jgi:hypothetical protein